MNPKTTPAMNAGTTTGSTYIRVAAAIDGRATVDDPSSRTDADSRATSYTAAMRCLDVVDELEVAPARRRRCCFSVARSEQGEPRDDEGRQDEQDEVAEVVVHNALSNC